MAEQDYGALLEKVPMLQTINPRDNYEEEENLPGWACEDTTNAMPTVDEIGLEKYLEALNVLVLTRDFHPNKMTIEEIHRQRLDFFISLFKKYTSLKKFPYASCTLAANWYKWNYREYFE